MSSPGIFWLPNFGSPSNPVGGSPFDHVFVLTMENQSYSDINGNTTDCPYINNTMWAKGVKFSAWDADHSATGSQADYLQLTGGSDQGIFNNANPPGSTCSEPSIFALVEAAGKNWKSYAQSYALVGTPLSSTFTDGDSSQTSSDGSNPLYVEHHVPCTHYTQIRSSGARSQMLDDFTRLTAAADLNPASLATTPKFLLINPDNDHNMHSGTSLADARTRGDTWLSTIIPVIEASLAWTSRKSLLVVWWDEGQTGVFDPPMFVMGSQGRVKSNITNSTTYHHYNALAMIEWALGLGDCGRSDVGASRIPEAFN